MKYRSGEEIRQLFLSFFESKQHAIEPSASLIPMNDPTLLWINSGVAALKKYFDGTMKPINPRITNSQKAIRTNDIENVGKTSRHHTFFEMLGNFSIGDYFKKEAIAFAYEFLTDEKWIGFDKDKLYITVHTNDEEAYRYWIEDQHVDPSHILKADGNYWEIGEGPSGPNSEIFYDRGSEYDVEGLGEKLFFEELENDRYIEVWNLVFSQYNAKADVPREAYQELPQKNIDTGMGLERLVSIVQEKETNFDTDLFMPIIQKTESLAKVSYQDQKMAYRVIADHIRTITFALADGALFSNEGRGYVLRRLLRRAIRFGMKIGIDHAIFAELVDVVADTNKGFYSYLLEKVDYIKKLVHIEESKFSQTLQEGEKILEEMIEKGSLTGEEAFKLYDTYGFPFELTVEICEEHGIDVDATAFEEEMAKQRARARESRKNVESMSSQSKDLLEFVEPSVFDYEPKAMMAKVIGLFKDGIKVDSLSGEGQVILNQTIFYAESGGQVADTGEMIGEHAHVQVRTVIKAPHKQHLHFVEVIGELSQGDMVELMIDVDNRRKIEANHTATHLMQQALKDVLGEHIGQAGSYVSSDYCRFDFTHFEKLSDVELSEVEKKVNHIIFQQLPVMIEYMPLSNAKEQGAIAFFDEKYGNEVRVVKAGTYSMELCGGCHVDSTGMIGLFKIISESSVGSGIRRIEAITGEKAFLYTQAKEEQLKTLSHLLKVNSIDFVVEKTTQLVNDYQLLKKENEQLNQKLTRLEMSSLIDEIEMIHDVPVLIKVFKDQDQLKELVIELKQQIPSGVICLFNQSDRLTYVVGVSDDLSKSLKAGDLVKSLNTLTFGRGGGKPDLAQGGSQEKVDLNQVIEAFKKDIVLNK